MPMNSNALKSKIKTRVYNGLKAQFSSAASKGKGFPPVADEFWQKLAEAISGLAIDVVMEIQNNAQVLPGIPSAGSPTSHVTVAPGKIK